MESAQLWHCCLKLQSFPENEKKKSFQDLWIDLSRCIASLFWMRVIFGIWSWFEWRFDKKTNPNLIFKLLPFKVTIDIPIIISYIIELQCLKSGFWIVTSKMQTPTWLDSSKNFTSSTTVIEIEVKVFWVDLREIRHGKVEVEVGLLWPYCLGRSLHLSSSRPREVKQNLYFMYKSPKWVKNFIKFSFFLERCTQYLLHRKTW